MIDSVLILGCATSTIHQAPVNRRRTEIWTVASFIELHPKAASLISRWFDLHHEPEKKHPQWWAWALERQPSCILIEKRDELVNSQAYPIDEMRKRFGSYFTSSISYMLALAIARRAKWIGIYGVDMACGSEYYYQRACCEFLIGIARGSGIEVEIPDESFLLRSRWLYGYDDGRPVTESERMIEEMSIWRAEALALRAMIPEENRPKPPPNAVRFVEEMQALRSGIDA